MSIYPSSHIRAASTSSDGAESGNRPSDYSDKVAQVFDDSYVTLEVRRVLRENLRALLDYYAAHPRAGRASSGAALEGLSGVSNSTISRYAPNQGPATASASIDHLARIAQAYDLPVWCLLYPGLNPAQPPVVRTPEDEAKNRLILEAAAQLLMRTGGGNVGAGPSDAGTDRSMSIDSEVPSGGPNYKAGSRKG
jgi:transcriptional regulator with XRE-family HTH domain